MAKSGVKRNFKKFSTIVNCVMFIAGIAMFFVCFISLSGYPHPERSPLYTEILNNPVYIKPGFDPQILLIDDINLLTDKDAMQWETVKPSEYTGNYLISNILEAKAGDERTFLSPADEPESEYTYFIPFELDSQAIKSMHGMNPVIPGMFLSGIGDNWEVFINGSRVASQIHLDEQDNIISHRSLRDVTFPLDNDILTEGTNSLIFRIIAPYSATDSGLYYSSGYYIGNYSDIKMQSLRIITVIFSTIYLFMGLYHLILFLMRKSDWYNLSYCFVTVAIAIYFVSRTSIINLISMDSAITQRIEYSVFYLMPLLLAIFIDHLNFKRIFPITKLYAVWCALLILLQCIFSTDFTNELLLIGQIASAAMILQIVAFSAIVTFVRRIKEQKNESTSEVSGKSFGKLFVSNLLNTHLGNIFIAIIFLAITGFFDILDAIFFQTGIILSQYSFFLFTVSTTFILARKFTKSFDLINAENETLEAAVRVRTVELEDQVRIAEFASRAKSDFLANMSHEIRTPINAVIGMTAIGRISDDIAKKDYSFDKISDASSHLLGVISDILDMSKIEANKLELARVTYNIREMLNRTFDVIRFKTDEKKQRFKVCIDADIPEWLVGDDQRLAQVITNLLSNAVKFTPENGDVSFKASLKEETEDACTLYFEVIDSGIGISEEQQRRIFSAFQQADSSTSRNYGGTGLGLAISRRIVEIMNGSIFLTSAPEKGSAFAFSVEMQKAGEAPAEALESDIKGEMLEGEFKGLTALLVEDIEVNREIVTSIMEPSGLAFKIAQNGQEAVDAFVQNPHGIDIIFMDIQMPVMDGYSAARAIRRLKNHNAKIVPIIAMTANVFKEDIENCIAAGMNAHIGKPIDMSELVLSIRKYVSGKK